MRACLLALSLLLCLLNLCSAAAEPQPCVVHIPSPDGSTRASFDFTDLQLAYPSFYSLDDPADPTPEPEQAYLFRLCGGQVPAPNSTDPLFPLQCVTGAGDAAVFQYSDDSGECHVVGRFGPDKSKTELLIDADYPALGPLGLKLTFAAGDNLASPVCATSSFVVNLRCPSFLNGFAPNPVGRIPQPGRALPPAAGSPPTRVPLVGYVREAVDDQCDWVVDIDSVYGCPTQCRGAIDTLSAEPAPVALCGGNGICRDVNQAQSCDQEQATDSCNMGCLCNQDRDGAMCEKPSTSTLSANNANTPLAAVSIVLLVLLLVLTCFLFRKLRYLNSDSGNVYGNLQPIQTSDGAN